MPVQQVDFQQLGKCEYFCFCLVNIFTECELIVRAIAKFSYLESK
jgi:hypothetical protein